MRTMHGRVTLAFVVLMVFVALVSTAAAAALRSRELAPQLTSLFSSRHMDAFAARDPDVANGYIAALFFPGSQLLVVSAQSTSPLVAQNLDAGAFRDVYTSLHQSSLPETKLFVQDIGADGLHDAEKQPVDVVYDKVVEKTIFDGNPQNDPAYAAKLTSADARYSRALQVLLDAARSE